MDIDIRWPMEQAIKSKKVYDKYKPRLGKALIKWAEKNDINEQELYIILLGLIDDMEECDPVLGVAKEMSETGEVSDDAVDKVKKVLAGMLSDVFD